MAKHKVAAIQMVSGTLVGPNLMTARNLIQKAVDQGAKLVALPENFACMTLESHEVHCIAEPFGNGRIQEWASRISEELGIWLVAGSIPLQSSNQLNKIRSASLVFDDHGIIVGRYDKMHLFDVTIFASGEHYCESDNCEPGDQVVVVDTPFGKLGLSICYDLRFPELYRALREKGADILLVPSAFTRTTGQVHWKPLLLARAIENQCMVIAPGQGGLHENRRETYGHSMVISPWGQIQSCLELGPGVALGEIDPLQCQILREDFPVFAHRRIK